MTHDTLYTVSYDLPDDKRRTKLAKLLINYGQRVQYSVFECYLDDERLSRLRGKINRILDEKEDQVRIYRICAACQKRLEVHGLGEPLPWGDESEAALIL